MTASSSAASAAYPVPSVDESPIYHTETTGGAAAATASAPARGGSSGGGAAAGPSFQIDSDGVRAQAAILAQCSDQIATILSTLRSSLTGGGEPWGTEDLGKSFGHSYTGPANQGFASIAGLPAALANVANALSAQADQIDQLDDQIQQTAVQAHKQVSQQA
jgi:uncharacterized protein YukE